MNTRRTLSSPTRLRSSRLLGSTSWGKLLVETDKSPPWFALRNTAGTVHPIVPVGSVVAFDEQNLAYLGGSSARFEDLVVQGLEAPDRPRQFKLPKRYKPEVATTTNGRSVTTAAFSPHQDNLGLALIDRRTGIQAVGVLSLRTGRTVVVPGTRRLDLPPAQPIRLAWSDDAHLWIATDHLGDGSSQLGLFTHHRLLVTRIKGLSNIKALQPEPVAHLADSATPSPDG